MKNRVAICARLLLGVVVLCSLGACDDVQREIDELQAELEKTRQMVDANMQRAVRAIPGERLLQMYDGIFSDDPAVAQKTKELLLRMAQADEEVILGNWAVGVEVEYDGEIDAPLDMDLIWVPNRHELWIERHLAGNGFQGSPLGPGSGFRYRPALSYEQVSQAIDAQLGALYNEINGLPGRFDQHPGNDIFGARWSWQPSGALVPGLSEVDLGYRPTGANAAATSIHSDPEFQQAVKQARSRRGIDYKAAFDAYVASKRARFVERIRTAILAAHPKDQVVTVQRFQEPIQPSLQNTTTCVVIRSAAWKKLDPEKLRVVAYVHEQGDPSKLHPYSKRTPIEVIRFSENREMFAAIRAEGGFRWACQVLLDYGFDRKILDIIQADRELEEALMKERGKDKA